MQRLVASLVLLAACHVSSNGVDNHKNDGSSIPSADLCTTASCAASPCTADCIYAVKAGSCPGAMPVEISGSKILGCSSRCGLRSMNGDDTSATAQSGYCWEFDRDAPGCVIPSCGFSSPQCTLVDDSFDYGGASMCAPGWTCTDGATIYPADASVYCPDLSTVD
jgi:hypothetical protein